MFASSLVPDAALNLEDVLMEKASSTEKMETQG